MAVVADKDANFCNGRLRLATFLRVVEKDMPPRPSRFKRRFQTPNESSRESKVAPAQDHDHRTAESVGLADRTSPGLSNTPVEPIDIIGEMVIGAPNGQNAADHVPEPVVALPVPSDHDLPRSVSLSDSGLKTPHQHAEGANGPATAFPGSNEPRLSKDRNKQARRKEVEGHQTSSSTKVSKAPKANKVSSSSRKRRPPVTGLALLRTTTSDGLPEPSHTDNISVASIADHDPIQDSQMNAASIDTLLVSGRLDLRTVRKSASDTRHLPPSARSTHVPQKQSPIARSLGLSTSAKRKQTRQKLQFIADGFVGDELNLSLAKKPRRRGRIESRQTQPKQVISALILAEDLFPVPVIRETMSASSTRGKATPSQMPFSKSAYNSNASNHGKLVLTRTQYRADESRRVKHSTQEQAHVVRNQLASITAPMRRESGSSASAEDSEYDRQTSWDTDDGSEDFNPLSERFEPQSYVP